MPILILRAENTNFTVSIAICEFSLFLTRNASVLMQWAEGGSLDDFIDIRMGRVSAGQLPQLHPSESTLPAQHGTRDSRPTLEPLDSADVHSRSARIRAFRALQHAPPEERERLRREMASVGMHTSSPSEKEWKPIHLFSAAEVKSLFTDVVEGLAFLVNIQLCCYWITTDTEALISTTSRFCILT